MASKKISSKWVNGNLQVLDKNGAIIFTIDGDTRAVTFAGGAITGNISKKNAKTAWFNLDNGAGTTVDDVIFFTTLAITITDVRAVYVDATTGTVAAGSFKVGTTLNGGEIAAATNYENAKAVGTFTTATIASGAVAANASIFVRHTGV